MRRWTRLSSRPVVQDRWFHVTADRCEVEPGTVIEPFYVVHENEWVHIYAVNANSEVLTVRQFRYAADVICTELPGGVVDETETHEVAAKRELLEETGHTADRWTYLGKLFANPARQTNSIHIYLAEGLHRVAEQALDESERIIWSFLSTTELERMVQLGEFSQALHVASLSRAQAYLSSRGDA